MPKRGNESRGSGAVSLKLPQEPFGLWASQGGRKSHAVCLHWLPRNGKTKLPGNQQPLLFLPREEGLKETSCYGAGEGTRTWPLQSRRAFPARSLGRTWRKRFGAVPERKESNNLQDQVLYLSSHTGWKTGARGRLWRPREVKRPPQVTQTLTGSVMI